MCGCAAGEKMGDGGYKCWRPCSGESSVVLVHSRKGKVFAEGQRREAESARPLAESVEEGDVGRGVRKGE